MNEQELADVGAQGIALILDDVTFTTVNNSTVSNDGQISINGTDGSQSRVILDYVSLHGDCVSCSPYNTDGGHGFTIGSPSDPLAIEFLSEQGGVLDNYVAPTALLTESRSFIQLSTPSASVVDPSLSARFTWDYDQAVSGDNDTGWLEINSLNLNNTTLRLWAENNIGVAVNGNINLHVDQLRYTYLTDDSGALPAADFSDVGSFELTDVNIDLKLGQRFYQPLRIYKGPGRIQRTASGPNTAVDSLIIELTPIPGIAGVYNDFYALPKSNISIGGARMGGYNLGSSRIEGIQIHHLRVALHDL